MKSITVLLSLLLLSCSQEDVSAATSKAGESYLKSQRDNVIKNWQSRVADSEDCKAFKDRFKNAGTRHENAVNGAFQMDMMNIMQAVKAAGCHYKP